MSVKEENELSYNSLILRNIIKSVDCNAKDFLGPDPFKTRVFESQSPFTSSFERLIKKYDQASPNQPVSSYVSEKYDAHRLPNEIPKIIWLAWFGSPLANCQHMNNIITLKKNNVEYEVVLWIDRKSFDKLVNNNTLDFYITNGIRLLIFEDIFLFNTKYMPIIQLGFYRPNYAFVSDVLRYLLFQMFGGIWVDIDVRSQARFGTLIAKNGMLFNNGIQYGSHVEVEAYGMTLNTNLIMSCKGCDINTEILKTMGQYFSSSASKLFEDYFPLSTGERVHYNSNYYKIDSKRYDMWSTVQLVGPYLIMGILNKKREFFKKHTKSSFNNYFIDENIRKEIQFICEGNWLKNNSHSFDGNSANQTEQAIKYIITNLLYELNFENRVLRLDRYASILGKYKICYATIRFLADYFSKSLSNITHIISDDCYFSIKTNSLFNNHSLFPSLANNFLLSVEENDIETD